MNTINQSTLQILVFGAAGRTGKLVVESALAAGHSVTALVRNPDALTIRHPQLQIARGDVLQLATFAPLVNGHDAVISCFGAKDNQPTILYSQGTLNILQAMQKAGVSRLMCLSSSAIEINPKLPLVLRLATKYVVQRLFKHPYADNRRMEQILRESFADWTAVRPPMLKDKPFTGEYRYAVNEFLERCISINRADLAYFLLQHVTDKSTFKTVVEVAN